MERKGNPPTKNPATVKKPTKPEAKTKADFECPICLEIIAEPV